MAKVRVGVLRGGPSAEYEVSLKTGGFVLGNLPQEKYQPRDILLTKGGEWLMEGLPTSPERLRHSVDVVFNALHGTYGEDGQVQHYLESVGIPYTGPRSLAAALSMNKALSKEYYVSHELKTPRGLTFNEEMPTEDITRIVFQKMGPPWVVKPVDNGSSVGVRIVRFLKDLPTALSAAFCVAKSILVEEFIRGREATCGVVDKYRGYDVYPLFPIEIVPPKEKPFFDYEAKYGGISQEICPGRFDDSVKHAMQDMAVRAHQALGLSHYSRSDFIVHPTRGIFILETNSLPGLTAESLVPKALSAAGARHDHFLDHIVTLALEGK